MTEENRKWKDYEEVAIYLLNQVASALGLEQVEGQQKVVGNRSGMEWTIDGRGIKSGGEGFVIIECRRYTTSRQKPEQMGGLAYRIIDTGAQGGIVVSPLGLQEGAAKVADAENIETIHMDENSTRTEYMFRFLSNVFLGLTETASAKDEISIEITRGHEAWRQ